MDAQRKPEGQPYELFMFAQKHGIPVVQAREILDRFGADRDGADRAAKEAAPQRTANASLTNVIGDATARPIG